VNHTARNGHTAFTAVIRAKSSTIDARGELEIFTVDLLRGALAHLALHHPAHIIIDLSEVTAIDRYSARLLLTWQNTGVPDGEIAVNLRNPNPDLAAILAATPTPLAPGFPPEQVDTVTAAGPERRAPRAATARKPRPSTTVSAPHRHIRRLTSGAPIYPASSAP
jgi:anti-anti-sigma regulatory factor